MSSSASASTLDTCVLVTRKAPSEGSISRRPLSSTYSDEKVANREIRVWHFVIENGY
jgi:hypothetical protein